LKIDLACLLDLYLQIAKFWLVHKDELHKEGFMPINVLACIEIYKTRFTINELNQSSSSENDSETEPNDPIDMPEYEEPYERNSKQRRLLHPFQAKPNVNSKLRMLLSLGLTRKDGENYLRWQGHLLRT